MQTVSWHDCVKWYNARSQKNGLTPVYYADASMTLAYKAGRVSEPYVKASANGYRLLAETEWEYAARGGVPGRRFPWDDGDTIQHARANYNSSISFSYDTSLTRGYHPTHFDGSGTCTSPAGSFAPDGYGLYDMSGNVWEWCGDWFPGYEGLYRVLRGGGWTNGNADCCRSAQRGGSDPASRFEFIGFRAILAPVQQ